MEANEIIKVAMTLSAPYSGSTFFAFLLNSHSLISCDGEAFPSMPDSNVTCSCGRVQIDCDYYRKVASHMLDDDNKSWNSTLFSHVPLYNCIHLINRALSGFWINNTMNNLQNFYCTAIQPFHRQEVAFLAAHERFMRNSLNLRKASVYFDGTKSLRRAERFASSDRFSVKAVHLIRDGRAFCSSYIKNLKLPRSSLTKAAKFWLKRIKKVDVYARRFPKIPLLHLRYEDLCRNPKKTLSIVCDFLELPYEECVEKVATSDHHILGNRMRANFTGQIHLDLSWQVELTHEEINRITGIMQKSLIRFNYLRDFSASR